MNFPSQTQREEPVVSFLFDNERVFAPAAASLPPNTSYRYIHLHDIVDELNERPPMALVVEVTDSLLRYSTLLTKACKQRRPLAIIAILPKNAKAGVPLDVENWATDTLVRFSPQDLWPAVRRALARRLLISIERGVSERLGDDPLSTALHAAIYSRQPFRFVYSLAAHVGSNQKSLTDHWSQIANPSTTELHHVVAWILLLRAIEERSRHQGVARTARKLGLWRSRLERIARARTGHSVAQLETCALGDLVLAFEAQVFPAFACDAGPSRSMNTPRR